MIEKILYTHGVEFQDPYEDQFHHYIDRDRVMMFPSTGRTKMAVIGDTGTGHSYALRHAMVNYGIIAHTGKIAAQFNSPKSFAEILEESRSIPIRNYRQDWIVDSFNPKIESGNGYKKPKSDSNVKPKKKKRKKKARNGR